MVPSGYASLQCQIRPYQLGIPTGSDSTVFRGVRREGFGTGGTTRLPGNLHGTDAASTRQSEHRPHPTRSGDSELVSDTAVL